MTTLNEPPGGGGDASSYRITANSDTAGDAGTGGTGRDAYQQVQDSPDFQQLRRSLRRFIFPATVVFLAWYMLYVLMSGYARGFMSTKLFGNINIAYVFGLLQFVSTFVIAYIYSKYAEKNLDPTADRLRAQIEGGHR